MPLNIENIKLENYYQKFNDVFNINDDLHFDSIFNLIQSENKPYYTTKYNIYIVFSVHKQTFTYKIMQITNELSTEKLIKEDSKVVAVRITDKNLIYELNLNTYATNHTFQRNLLVKISNKPELINEIMSTQDTDDHPLLANLLNEYHTTYDKDKVNYLLRTIIPLMLTNEVIK